MKYLLIIPLLFGIWLFTPKKVPAPVTRDASCPIWVCTGPVDSRSMEEYIAECQPIPAYYQGSTQIWCRDNTNPLDKLPPEGAEVMTWGQYLGN